MTLGRSTRKGNETGTRSNAASAETIVAAAASRSSSRPGRPGTVDGLQPAQSQGGVAVLLVDLLRDLSDEVLERRLVDLGRRMDVGAEDAYAEPAEAAERAEAVTLPTGGLDARAPVDLDAECARADLPLRPAARNSTGT